MLNLFKSKKPKSRCKIDMSLLKVDGKILDRLKGPSNNALIF